MSPPSSAREALIAELMGELSTILDRTDALIPALNAACGAITRASAEMEAKATQAECRLSTLTEAAKVQAVKHIAQRTEDLMRRSTDTQARAMQLAAHEAFRTELASAIQNLQQTLKVRSHWRAHAITAIGSSLVTASLTMFLLTP